MPKQEKRTLPVLTGDIMVFQNKGGFSTTISRKNEEGEYQNLFIPVSFRKEDEKDLKHMDVLKVYDAFLSFFLTKDGDPVIKIVVLDFEVLHHYEEKEKQDKRTTRR